RRRRRRRRRRGAASAEEVAAGGGGGDDETHTGSRVSWFPCSGFVRLSGFWAVLASARVLVPFLYRPCQIVRFALGCAACRVPLVETTDRIEFLKEHTLAEPSYVSERMIPSLQTTSLSLKAELKNAACGVQI